MFDILRMCMVVLEPFFFLFYHSSKEGVSFIEISICAEFFCFLPLQISVRNVEL